MKKKQKILDFHSREFMDNDGTGWTLCDYLKHGEFSYYRNFRIEGFEMIIYHIIY